MQVDHVIAAKGSPRAIQFSTSERRILLANFSHVSLKTDFFANDCFSRYPEHGSNLKISRLICIYDRSCR